MYTQFNKKASDNLQCTVNMQKHHIHRDNSVKRILLFSKADCTHSSRHYSLSVFYQWNGECHCLSLSSSLTASESDIESFYQSAHRGGETDSGSCKRSEKSGEMMN